MLLEMVDELLENGLLGLNSSDEFRVAVDVVVVPEIFIK